MKKERVEEEKKTTKRGQQVEEKSKVLTEWGEEKERQRRGEGEEKSKVLCGSTR